MIRADVHPEQKAMMVEAADGKLDEWMVTTLMREALRKLGFKSLAEWRSSRQQDRKE